MRQKQALLLMLALFVNGQLAIADNDLSHPNIIFLLTDDHRWDAMGAMGNKLIKTPQMDRLAKAGTLFEQAFVTTSICAVSRASILSGQYARRHGINDFKTMFDEERWQKTYPMLLKQAGYKIGFVGKFGVGRQQTLPSNDFDYWKGIAGQPVYEQQDSNGNYQHLTRMMSEQGQEFLRLVSNDSPFCLSISFKAPHVQDSDPRQFVYDRAYKDMFSGIEIPEPKTADPKYWNRFPDFFKTENNEARRRWRQRFETPEKYQASVKGYYRLIYGVDRAIGEIRNELDKLGLADNTIIILMGDNGFYLGEHGLAGKWFGHEESIRVPLLIFDPRRTPEQRNKKVSQIALNIDIAPTILSFAGLPVPIGMQGRDLQPLVEQQSKGWRSDFYYEHPFGYGDKIPKSEGVIGREWKYLTYIEQEPKYEQLFHLKSDPHETTNLAGSADFRAKLQQMRSRYAELKESAK